ncbi:dTMP kinase [Methanosphaerula palustris]|jgi:dTMP kinase|uniref:Probable thymidylate kinase n=1 Tax=Methanosphaerula palustris (strain ATCC BAA-1556 / DSM 19958 / E1-9c) TaxID=521011 RepID=B8GDL1_METPE|nr:dTMP kinase [Methanosphaerula palustris]ACL17362.1 dTMP kinase [Methanosphaerula palustris E1-9c]
MVLITIEGIDGAGKSSLVRRLKHSLADLDPIFTREPGSTWIGESVRRGIAEEIDPVAEALLFAADHAAHIARVIRPGLAKNRVIISDRYVDSRYAYQSVMLKGVLPDPGTWLRQVHQHWSIAPDLTFLMVLPVGTALARITRGRPKKEHFEQTAVLEAVQQQYLALARAEPSRFVVIDAELDLAEVHHFMDQTIREAVRRNAGSSRSHP